MTVRSNGKKTTEHQCKSGKSAWSRCTGFRRQNPACFRQKTGKATSPPRKLANKVLTGLSGVGKPESEKHGTAGPVMEAHYRRSICTRYWRRGAWEAAH